MYLNTRINSGLVDEFYAENVMYICIYKEESGIKNYKYTIYRLSFVHLSRNYSEIKLISTSKIVSLLLNTTASLT